MSTLARAREAESKLRKRSAIMRAAVQVIAERGYFAARMADVAAQAKVADGTLYLYFQGKEDLLASIFEEYANAFMHRAKADLEDLEDPRQRLARVIERHLVSFERDRALAHVFQIELRHTRRFLRRVAKGKVAEYLQLLQQVVSDGMKQGAFRTDIPAEVAARIVFGSIDECVTAWVLAERPGRLAAQAEPLTAVLLQGLEPPDAKVGDTALRTNAPGPRRRAGGDTPR